MINEAPQGKGVGFAANMAIGNPGELAEVGDRAGLSHARQAEIESVGQEARHQDLWVGDRFAAAQMGEAIGEQRPAHHLRQQVGDADAQQHRVKAGGECLGFRRRRFFDRRDLQHPLLERDIGQQAACRLGVNRPQTRIETGAAASDETLEIGIERNRQSAALQHLLVRFAGDEILFEGAVAATTDDPDVPGAQPTAQLRQDAELVITPT
jgi:hypothetical protein